MDVEDNLQTHFMGDLSYGQHYAVGDVVPLLEGVTVTLDGRIDRFIGGCHDCLNFIDFGAEIVEGRVVRVWPLVPVPA